MTRKICWVIAIVFVAVGSSVIGDDRYEPADSIAAVDGKPIYVGELNLVLSEKLGVEKSKQAAIELQQATALLLVRRHLAMKSLVDMGGESLESIIQRRLDTFAEELKRRRSSLSKHAESQMGDEQSLVADLSWKVAWGEYLKSRMTDENLRRYFDKHREQYGGGTFDELTDQAKLRRDATSAMFDSLVQKRRDAEIQWLIPALRPPEGVAIIPGVDSGSSESSEKSGP